MKNTILFVLLCLFSAVASFAQIKSLDKIVKLDNAVIECYIDEISEEEVFYRLANTTQGKELQKIKRQEVWKILHASGITEVISTPIKEISKVDSIFRKDGRVIEAKIINANQWKIEYKSTKGADDITYMIAGEDVDKVVYSDGSIKSFIKKKNNISRSEKKTPDFQAKMNQQVTSSKPRQLLDMPRIVLGLVAEANYVLEPLSKKWVSTSDTVGGLQQGLGVGFKADFHITKGIALSTSIGFREWQVKRNYILNDIINKQKTIEYSSLDKFSIMPIQAGLKLYVAKTFYLMPEVSFNLISSSFSTKNENDVYPSGEYTRNLSVQKLGYGGALGFEVHKLPYVIDVSLHYNSIQIASFRNIGEPLSFIGLKLGMGLAMNK